MNSPCGVRTRTTAPGTRSSWAVVSTVVCSTAWLIGLSAGGVALAAGMAGVDAVLVDGLDAAEHPATRRATPTSKLFTWRCPLRRRDGDGLMSLRTPLLWSCLRCGLARSQPPLKR